MDDFIDDTNKEASLMRPKDEKDFKNMFWEWMREFHAKYLNMEKSEHK
jgi:hypothetical protein